MKLQLIHTENYLLVTFKDRYDEKKYQLFKSTYGDFWINEPNSGKFRTGGHYYNITHHLPLNNAPILEGVPLLPPLEDDESICPYPEEKQNAVDWHNGYNKAKEKYFKSIPDWVYTNLCYYDKRNPDCSMDDEDIEDHKKSLLKKDKTCNCDNCFYDRTKIAEFIIQSLQQPKYPVAFECEMVDKGEEDWIGDDITGEPFWNEKLEPKIITNSQGLTQLVGKYIY